MSERPKKNKLASGARKLKQNIKTAKGRKISSTRWLTRHINDPFVLLSKRDDYRSRAAYKLLAIDDKFKILARRNYVVDLGAAPGGWSQVVRQKVPDALVVAVDLKMVDPIEGVICLESDFLAPTTAEKITQIFSGHKPDLILSDMAASSCGDKSLDHLRIINLVQAALDFCCAHLAYGGHFVAKILQGGKEKELMENLRKQFTSVHFFKPEASYSDSSEIYIVAKKFKFGARGENIDF